MLSRARLSAAKLHSTNTSFVNSRITAVNLPDASADVVISNCVINLVPDAEKQIVFKEMHRILKPGGRVAVSDILIKKTLPEALKKNVALYVGCFAGASRKEEYEGWLADAGFADVMIVDAGSDLNVYTRGEGDAGCCGGGEEVNVEKEGCCGTSKQGSDGGVVADMKRDLSGVDLNECAGESEDAAEL
jgi:arsenite methyltransferase